MAEALAHVLLIGGNQLAYRVGRLLIAIVTVGNVSVEPLPKRLPTHFTQAFDEDKVTRAEGYSKYAVSYEKTLTIGYIVILTGFCTILFIFRDYFMDPK